MIDPKVFLLPVGLLVGLALMVLGAVDPRLAACFLVPIVVYGIFLWRLMNPGTGLRVPTHEACNAPEPNGPLRCDKPKGHQGDHWTAGGRVRTWPLEPTNGGTR